MDKILRFFTVPRARGSHKQRRYERKFFRYVCAGTLLGLSMCIIFLGGILPRNTESNLFEKYRAMVVVDSLDDSSPLVRFECAVGGWVCVRCATAVGCGVASGGGWLCATPDVSPCKHMCMLLRAHWAGGRAGGRASEQARLAARPAQLAAPLGLPSCPRMTALGCRVSCSYTRVQGPRQRARSS
jgi:hypothetical protein